MIIISNEYKAILPHVLSNHYIYQLKKPGPAICIKYLRSYLDTSQNSLIITTIKQLTG
jgi:hypothetical protein